MSAMKYYVIDSAQMESLRRVLQHLSRYGGDDLDIQLTPQILTNVLTACMDTEVSKEIEAELERRRVLKQRTSRFLDVVSRYRAADPDGIQDKLATTPFVLVSKEREVNGGNIVTGAESPELALIAANCMGGWEPKAVYNLDTTDSWSFVLNYELVGAR